MGRVEVSLRLVAGRAVAIAMVVMAIGAAALAAPATKSGPFSGGPLGAGLVVGDPTGLSANYRFDRGRSVDAALAWAFGSETGIEIHSDFLWHKAKLFQLEKLSFDSHFGIGARFISVNNRPNDPNRTRLGPRLPVGLGTDFNTGILEAFAEIALVMNLVPSSSADVDVGVGARIYF